MAWYKVRRSGRALVHSLQYTCVEYKRSSTTVVGDRWQCPPCSAKSNEQCYALNPHPSLLTIPVDYDNARLCRSSVRLVCCTRQMITDFSHTIIYFLCCGARTTPAVFPAWHCVTIPGSIVVAYCKIIAGSVPTLFGIIIISQVRINTCWLIKSEASVQQQVAVFSFEIQCPNQNPFC